MDIRKGQRLEEMSPMFMVTHGCGISRYGMGTEQTDQLNRTESQNKPTFL